MDLDHELEEYFLKKRPDFLENFSCLRENFGVMVSQNFCNIRKAHYGLFITTVFEEDFVTLTMDVEGTYAYVCSKIREVFNSLSDAQKITFIFNCNNIHGVTFVEGCPELHVTLKKQNCPICVHLPEFSSILDASVSTNISNFSMIRSDINNCFWENEDTPINIGNYTFEFNNWFITPPATSKTLKLNGSVVSLVSLESRSKELNIILVDEHPVVGDLVVTVSDVLNTLETV